MIFGLSDLSGAVWLYLDVSVPARGVLLVTSLAGVMFSYTVLQFSVGVESCRTMP